MAGIEFNVRRAGPSEGDSGMLGSSAELTVFTGVVINKSCVLNPGRVRDTVSNKRIPCRGNIIRNRLSTTITFFPPNEITYNIVNAYVLTVRVGVT